MQPEKAEEIRAWLTKASSDLRAAGVDYAWAFRYPGDREEPSGEEAEEALALARQVYATVVARLPGQVRP